MSRSLDIVSRAREYRRKLPFRSRSHAYFTQDCRWVQGGSGESVCSAHVTHVPLVDRNQEVEK